MSGAPDIPTALQVYNSYVEDPKWQRTFSIIWASFAGAAIVVSVPYLLSSIRRGRAFSGFFGVSDHWRGNQYRPMASEERIPEGKSRRSSPFLRPARFLKYLALSSLPGMNLSVGQVSLVLVYLVAVLICVVVNAPLMDNPNRAGFLALAQFPVVFLLGTKNSLLSFLLGPGNGYERLNFIHRWSGRSMFLGALIHGALWIRNHLQYGLPILGHQKESSGVAAFAALSAIVLFSLKPVRKYFYQAFFVVHVLTFVAFFITVCYHTIYASPWIFPPLAFYGADLVLRLLRYRIKDATLTPVDNQMTIIRIANCDDGWLAGQHVRLRVFFSGRIFESHPLTILNAPPSISCLSKSELILGARVSGDWSRALNFYASNEKRNTTMEKVTTEPDAQVHVMVDGPYGGCSIELGQHTDVLLVAGGSGATFTIGVLDDIVGRCIKLGRQGGERTRRIEFVWCIRSFGSIEWFAPMLKAIATTASGSSLDLHISIYVTCLCNPESVPDIPNSDVILGRPSVETLIEDFLFSSSPRPSSSSSGELESDGEKAAESFEMMKPGGLDGNVAICVSGSDSLRREARNAVARFGIRRDREVGAIALHTEVFSL